MFFKADSLLPLSELISYLKAPPEPEVVKCITIKTVDDTNKIKGGQVTIEHMEFSKNIIDLKISYYACKPCEVCFQSTLKPIGTVIEIFINTKETSVISGKIIKENFQCQLPINIFHFGIHIEFFTLNQFNQKTLIQKLSM
ncbi:MAG: hypothetical protein JHC93_00845 [Parachlamydiales bacterium]|nr:hypothetical protein [Parachlamydiales bacterium]